MEHYDRPLTPEQVAREVAWQWWLFYHCIGCGGLVRDHATRELRACERGVPEDEARELWLPLRPGRRVATN